MSADSCKCIKMVEYRDNSTTRYLQTLIFFVWGMNLQVSVT